MIQSDKRPKEDNFGNITDYSLKCPDGFKTFFTFVHFIDASTCIWSNIFAKTRSGALSQVLLKFADCGDQIESINLYEH